MAKRVLVIDDEEGIRDAFDLALEDCGYDVVLASSGEEGLERAQERKPDLVFLDLRMPGIGGVETLKRLHGCCAEIPVYIVTAFYQEFMRPLRALSEEGVPFQLAKKPLGAEEIRTIARSVLG